MTDVWPYGPPVFTSWQAVHDYFTNNGFSSDNAAVFAAIAEAEASFDLSVINDDASTGDYSVGTFQINYLGSLGPERTRLFGTPQQLIQGGLDAQAAAAHYLWSGSGGWTDWSTYNNGEYAQYLHGAPTGGSVSGSGEPTIQEGSTGPAVITLQTDLDRLGDTLVIDGDFGPATRAAVIHFQATDNLTPDGIVGPLTWAAITTALGQSLTPPQPATPPPPSEPPGNVDGDTLSAWSSLATAVSTSVADMISATDAASNALRGI